MPWLLLVLLVWVMPLAAEELSGYASVQGPCNLSFPRDHGSHDDYRTEWWYYTGRMLTAEGRVFGFQLTFFRSRLAPPGAEQSWPPEPSAWRTSQVYLAHAALSDVAGGRHWHAERTSRGALGLAGTGQQGQTVTIWLSPWSAQIGPETHRLLARADEFALELELIPQKPPVRHGEQGFSRKGSQAGRASCYASFTRLALRGTIQLDGHLYRGEGLAWMDHEFSTAPLEPGIRGWDWFSLQLQDGRELMLYELRLDDGQRHAASSGSVVEADGTIRHLTASDFSINVLAHWTSPASGVRYPARWRVSVPSANLELTLTPALSDQEMRTTAGTGVSYWEGLVQASGTGPSPALAGSGYVELTGYAQAMATAPM